MEKTKKEALWKRITTNLETLPVVVSKQCFLDSLSETIRDDQVVCFLEYQRISDNNGKIVGSAALVSIVDPEYFIETMKFLSKITGKESYVDLRNRTWQEIKFSSRAASDNKLPSGGTRGGGE
ncbi:MAG: hypothetical protein QHH75_11920 [Bacillota bacterium]|nr:hypothetical protein [Bacillota bacterium]